MKVLAVPPDGERLAVDFLEAALAFRAFDGTVGIDIPDKWTLRSKNHVQVAMDGTPTGQYPVLFNTVIRVTAWSSSSTEAKALAALCQGLLMAHTGQPGWDGCRFGTGVLPARDPGTKAELASITVIAKLRGSPV